MSGLLKRTALEQRQWTSTACRWRQLALQPSPPTHRLHADFHVGPHQLQVSIPGASRHGQQAGEGIYIHSGAVYTALGAVAAQGCSFSALGHPAIDVLLDASQVALHSCLLALQLAATFAAILAAVGSGGQRQRPVGVRLSGGSGSSGAEAGDAQAPPAEEGGTAAPHIVVGGAHADKGACQDVGCAADAGQLKIAPHDLWEGDARRGAWASQAGRQSCMSVGEDCRCS